MEDGRRPFGRPPAVNPARVVAPCDRAAYINSPDTVVVASALARGIPHQHLPLLPPTQQCLLFTPNAPCALILLSGATPIPLFKETYGCTRPALSGCLPPMGVLRRLPPCHGRLEMALALVITVAVAVVASAAAGAAANAAAADRAPPSSSLWVPLPPSMANAATVRYQPRVRASPPPPRPPAWRVNTTACAARYRATHDAAAYLCCIDVSMGFCVAGLRTVSTLGGLCTLDWTRTLISRRPLLISTQCCVAQSGSARGVRWTINTAGVVVGAPPRSTPRLAVTCRRPAVCSAWKMRVRSPRGALLAAETAGRCGSWASWVYRRCERQLCLGLGAGESLH